MTAVNLQQHFEQEKVESTTEQFSAVDLKEFNDLITDKDSFDALVKGFEEKSTIKEIQEVKGLKDALDASIVTKKDLASIFDKTYEETIETDKDLYEICVLGAILTKGKISSTDYTVLAKEYYESINTVEAKEEIQPNIEGTYTTASADLKTETQTKIETEVKIEDGKQITEASVTISAGADQRKMNITKAQEENTKKIDELKTIKAKFTDTNNQAQIQAIIDELSKSNIESKITDKSSKKKDNTEQHGNRYLIAARMAEGFIKALNKLTLSPEPKLILKIEWENCSIGEVHTDTENDRFIHMNISVTVETSNIPQTNIKEEEKEKEKEKEKENEKEEEKNNTPRDAKDLINDDKEMEKNDHTNQFIEKLNKTAGSENKTAKTEATEERVTPNVDVTVTGGGKGGPNMTGNKVEVKESPEVLQLKQDVSDHFKFQNKDINAQEVTDIAQNGTDKNKYQVTIKGYTDFIVSYIGENIEISQGTVKKGLLKFDIKAAQTTKVDRVSKDRTAIKKNIDIDFNANKSKEYINKKLLTTTTGDQGKYEVKNDADVTQTSIKIEYTNTKTLKPGEDKKQIVDKMTISLDNDFMINKGKDKSIPLERQKIKGETTKVNCIKPYKIDDEATTLTYYTKTSGGTKDPSITLINNITQTKEDATGNITKIPLFTGLTNLTKQDRTLEEYTKKVMLTYDTPKTTTIEKTFQEGATIEYDNSKYAIKATFNIPGKKALTLTLPITYIEGSVANNNTSSVKYGNKPQLSWTDEYNKINNNEVMIDGIIYDIGVADQKQKNMPTIFFRHIEDKTLEKAKEWTKRYTIESNIFGIKKVNDAVQGYTEVNAGFGNCKFGPLTVKDGKWEDPITYYKELYVGQIKDGDMLLLQGTKIGTMHFDQQGKFLEYQTNDSQMTFDKQTNKVDLTNNTPIGIKNPLGKTGKNLLITQDMEGTTLNVNVMNPNDTYTKEKTGVDFVKTQDANKAKDIDEHFYTGAETKLMIGESRIAIYEGLKKISSDDINEKSKNLFNFVNEKDKKPNTVLGPDWKGVYTYKLINGSTDGEYPAQYIYCKVNNKKISLCNTDGDILEEQKILLEQNNDYYDIKINDDQTQFTITGKEKEEQSKIPTLDISTNKDYKQYIGDLDQERNCGYRSAKSEDENSYQFMCNKYTSYKIDIKGDEIQGEDKISDISSFSLVNENEEDFGTYKDFFVTKYQKNLGIDEKTYKEVFGKVFQEQETNTDTLVRVKYKKGKKSYYIPMNIEVNKKGGKTTFEMEPSKGREGAIKETEKRLDNLVKAYSIFLEQDISDKTKGDTIQGRYLVKPTMESINRHFKDPTQNIELVLQTNNKINGEYQKETILFDPKKETIDKKTVTVNNIQYSLSLKPDSKLGYKIIVKKGDIGSAE